MMLVKASLISEKSTNLSDFGDTWKSAISVALPGIPAMGLHEVLVNPFCIYNECAIWLEAWALHHNLECTL